MNEDNLSFFPEDEIRAPRQVASMQSISVSKCVNKSPNEQLRSRILPANSRHSFRTLLGRQGIHTLFFLWGAEKRPLIRNVLFGRFTDDPGQRYSFFPRDTLESLVNF